MTKRRFIASAFAAVLLAPCAASAEPLTTDAIVALSKTGLGDDAIVAKIKSDGTPFDLSTDQMIALKQAGVSSAVIAAMLGNKLAGPVMSIDSPDPAVPHPAGLYILTGSGAQAKMRRIDPTVSNQAKTGGILGYALTGGLASASIKVAIQNESAPTKTTGSPRFYFFFDQATNASASGTWASGMNTVVSSPAEFTLIRLTRKDGRREARVGSMNIAGAKTGVMDKDRLTFSHQMVRPGVYQVDVAQLQPGEYGFIFSLAGGGAGGAMTARIFDFSVDPALAYASPRQGTRRVDASPNQPVPTGSSRPLSTGTADNRGMIAKGVRCDTCRY